MEITSFAQIFIGAVGGATVALSGAWYLSKRILDLQIARATEKYKAQLDQRSATLKTELSIYAHEQTVGLSRIDSQRSDAILKIWKILAEWHEHFLEITAPNNRLDMHMPTAVGHYRYQARQLFGKSNELSRVVRLQSILFDQNSYETISRCGSAINDVTCEFYGNIGLGKPDPTNDAEAIALFPTVQEERAKLRDASAGNIETLRNALVRELRVLMNAEKGIRNTVN